MEQELAIAGAPHSPAKREASQRQGRAADPSSRKGGRVVAYMVSLVFLAVAYAVAQPSGNRNAFTLALIAASLVTLLGAIGSTLSGRLSGVLVTKRNLMSLSRFQSVLWTVIILAGFGTLAFIRLKGGDAKALDVSIEWPLWALIGISTTSLVGTPLLLSTKTGKEPGQQAAEKAARLTGEAATAVEQNREGTLYANENAKDARFEDMFQGDEVGNTGHLDLAKVQMFFFTLVAAVVYCASLVKIVTAGQPGTSALPTLSEGFIAMMGISHAGYLVNKAVDHTPRRTDG